MTMRDIRPDAGLVHLPYGDIMKKPTLALVIVSTACWAQAQTTEPGAATPVAGASAASTPAVVARAASAIERGVRKTGAAIERGAIKTEAALRRGVEKTGRSIKRGGEKIEEKARAASASD